MTSPESLAQTFPDDLAWQAFLYVSGELTPDEVVDFEERLLSDQSAREAVAVKLDDGVCAAWDAEMTTLSHKTKTAVGERKQSSHWIVWTIGSVLAASLAFFVGWWVAGPNASSSDGVVAASSQAPPPVETDLSEIEGAGRLLALWADSQSLLDSEVEDGPSLEYPAQLSEEFAQRESHSEEGEEEFAWLLSAVSASPADSPVMEN